MLTLRPLQLHTAEPMLTVSESFHEKILSNYELLGVSFQPKDLLLLMTAPPELPEELGGVTNLSMSSNFRNSQQVLLEVVNNVLNRILIAERADFTYQDTVYITGVLQKLGITNVSEFMRQVKALREENESVSNLLRLYESHWNLLMKPREQASGKPAPGGEPAEAPPAGPGGARYTIHNEIYQRLGTAAIYELYRQLAAERSRTDSFLSSRELRTSEQARVSQDLRLAELKGRTVFRESVTLRHHINHYELGDLLPVPATEQEALSAGAAAVLLSAVDNVMVTRLNSVLRRSDFWLDIRSALTQSAENSLSRFEYYMSHADTRQLRREASYSEQLSKLFQDETEVLNRLFSSFTREGDKLSILPPGESGPIPSLTLEHRTTEESREETVVVAEGEEKKGALPKEAVLEATRSVLERMTAPGPPAGRPVIPPPPGAQTPPGTEERLELQHRTDAEKEIRTERDATQRLTQRETEIRTQTAEERPGEPGDVLRGTLLSKETRESVTRELAGRPEEGGPAAEPAPEVLILDSRSGDLYETTQEQHRVSKETVRQTEQLKERIERAGERSLETAEHRLLEQKERIRTEAEAQGLERARAGERGAPGEPGRVSAETPPGTAPAAMEHRRSPAWETLLGQMNEKTRRIYETALLYGENPQLVREPDLRPGGAAASFPEGPAGSPVPPSMLVFENREGDLYETDGGAQRLARETVQKTETLKTRLDELNLRNRELYEHYQTQRLESIRENLSVPDRKRAFTDALRAIGEPEQVIAELMSGTAPAEMEHRRSPTVETLLGRMDEKTRQVMESVLLYQENPQAAMEKGLLRPSGIGAFNADTAAVETREVLELAHPDREREDERASESDRGTGADILERYREPRTGIEEPSAWNQLPKARTVFRQTETGLSEELLERLENRHTQELRTVENTDTVTNQTITQTEVNNLRQEVVTNTTEDLTELINRAMARQLGSITDRVYSQMERRLESERARRGRF